jgi:hypothetical protein
VARTDRVCGGEQAPVDDEQPTRLGTSPEFRLATAATRFCALLALPTVVGGWLTAGRSGLAGAAIAVVLVAAQLCFSAAVLAICARRGGATLLIGGYMGFVGRLALTTGVLIALLPREGIHMPTLVIASIVLMIAVLVYEVWHVSRHPSFFWLEPRPALSCEGNQVERTRA